MAQLEVRGLTKAYSGISVLKDISLSVAEGEFVCLLGPSGCGKTTLLRIICGIDRPSQGHLFFHGSEITHLPPQRRRFGVVFQSYALFPNLTAEQNVRYGLQSLKGPQQRERAQEMLALVGLEAYGERFPAQLSGGQQQRVALARALAPQPALLLLDEPLSALDAKVREGLRHEIVAIQRRLGIPTIMVTHDQEEALEMADRVVLMHNGEIAQEDSPLNLYRAPTSRFSAGFVGRVNLLSAVIEAEGLRIGPTLWPAHPCWSAPSDMGASVTLAVRPQQISIFPEGSSLPLVDIAGDAVVLPGRVTHVRFAGASWGIEVQCGALNQVLRVEQMNTGQATAPWGTDSRVLLAIPHAALLPVPASASL
jgi:iron(III) transport system ATP-binding protein